MVAILIVVLAVMWRMFLPQLLGAHYLFGFTPVLAALLFFGARQPRKWLWAPALLLAASDLYLNLHYGYKTTPDFVFTWIWYAGAVWLGCALREKQSVLRVGAVALAGSVSFFLVSNFFVWMALGNYQMYPKTFAGLMTCFAAGIPFYRNEFVGDMVFTALIFGIPALVKMLEKDSAHQAA